MVSNTMTDAERGLTGRVAWVTGGATGMGRAIALALARAGVKVAIGSLAEGGELPPAAYAARPSLAEIERTVEAIRSKGVEAFGAPLDVRNDRSVDDFH